LPDCIICPNPRQRPLRKILPCDAFLADQSASLVRPFRELRLASPVNFANEALEVTTTQQDICFETGSETSTVRLGRNADLIRSRGGGEGVADYESIMSHSRLK